MDLASSQPTNNVVRNQPQTVPTTPQTPVVQDNSPVQSSAPQSTSEPKKAISVSTDFSDFMKKVMTPRDQGQVSEEDLFAAIMEQRVTKESAEAGEFFKTKRLELMETMRSPSGFVPMEDLAKAVMREVVAAGHLTEEKAKQIHGESFRAAQLDDNLDALYDHLGGADDVTMATAQFDEALEKAYDIFEQIDKGELKVDPAELDRPSNTKTSSAVVASGIPRHLTPGTVYVDGADGFLWKPESESDGHLLVLMPQRLKDQVKRVEIHSSLPPTPENLLATHEKMTGYHAGNRGKFRFDRHGAEFGKDIYVVAYKTDGTTENWKIEDGSKRND